jgi:NAD-reducing hydrogenase small subunit
VAAKKRIATLWFAGCSGCHMSLLDLDERLLDLARSVDIVKSPLVDGKEIPEVDVALVEGAVANAEHVAEALEVRRKAKVLISFGDCAATGNVSAMRNAVGAEAALERAYRGVETNDPGGAIPGAPGVAALIGRVVPLHEVVPVDVVLPGCPPSADLIFYVLSELVEGRMPVLDKGRLKYG